MKTIICLTKVQADELIKTMQYQSKTFDEKKYSEHNNWKLEFNDDGSIRVWSGAWGLSTKEKLPHNLKYHVCCPSCGSSQIDEIKPLWMVCKNCGENFHKEVEK